MPCRDDGYCDRDPVADHNKNVKTIEKLTALLCSASQELKNFGYNFDLNPELSRWYDAHKKADQERLDKELKEELEKERVRQEMQRALEVSKTKKISDLTKEEMKLLKKYRIL